ncbi:MAG: hypothetical protein Q7S36_00445 [Candidatus Liptonbacteria bacterium]|nr:hypothetical protein [Candidatus Liptonbacteria bacterium]
MEVCQDWFPHRGIGRPEYKPSNRWSLAAVPRQVDCGTLAKRIILWYIPARNSKEAEMANVTVILVEPGSKGRRRRDFSRRGKGIDLRSLGDRQKEYFREAYADFLSGMDCWEFERKYLSKGEGMSKLRAVVPWDGSGLFKHPLYMVLEELWLALGINNNQMKVADRDRTVYILT